MVCELKSNVLSRLLFGFSWRDFPENLHLALSTHARQTVKVWLQSVASEGHFTSRTKFLFGCISGFKAVIFVNIHAPHFPHMRDKRWKFGCDRSLVKDTLPREQSSFSAVSRVLKQWFSWIFTRLTYHACATNGESLFAIDHEWRVLYLEYKVPFRLNVGFHPWDTNSASLVAIGQ
jgi:hypothetical protein